MSRNIIIVGGGASGFFTAINIAEKHPEDSVSIVEKTSKVLSKVKVSGGGRCNVTNGRTMPAEVAQYYPRGQKKLKKALQQFGTSEMRAWLEAKGVATHVEDDLRVFPATNNSQTIIDCFVNEAYKLGVKVHNNEALESLTKMDNGQWIVNTTNSERIADVVVIATGTTKIVLNILKQLNHQLNELAPSLFTFNIKDPRLEGLPGVSFENTQVKITKTKLEQTGPMLITHWGLSGPSILRLSAWGARILQEKNYQFEILVNFAPEMKYDDVNAAILQYKSQNPKRKVSNYPLFDLPRRFWERITEMCGICADELFGDLSKKQMNRLTEELAQGRYSVDGKSTFKEEFVTCGGVALSEINMDTFESRHHKNLFLAGELLEIDGVTGGFNFQACWTAGWAISEAL